MKCSCATSYGWECYECLRLFCWRCDVLADPVVAVSIKTAVRKCEDCKQGSAPVPPVAPTT